MAPQLSPNDRERIVSLKLSGYKVSDIHRLTGITRHTIHLWLKRWEELGELTAYRRHIYQRATTAPQDAEIVAAHAADPHLSPRAMSSKYRISVHTVRRRIKEATSNKQQQSQSQSSQHIRYENDGIDIAPIVSLSEENRILQMGLQKDNMCIQTHIDRLNSQFARVTNVLAQDVTKRSLTVIKRLENILSSIETPAQAKSFVSAAIQSTKKKRTKPKPKAVARRKEIGTIKKPVVNGRPDVPEVNTDDKLKLTNATRKTHNFRTIEEVPQSESWPCPNTPNPPIV